MSPTRRISFAFGVLYLITFATSIPALLLFQPVLDDPVGYVANGGSHNRIFLGAFLELLLIIANIGTAVVVYPLLKRAHHILALSYVAARIMECVFILVGLLAVLAVVTLRHDAGADAASLGRLAESLAAIKDWTFRARPRTRSSGDSSRLPSFRRRGAPICILPCSPVERRARGTRL